MPVEYTENGVRLREPEDMDTLRADIFDSVRDTFGKVFPQEYKGARVELKDVHYDGPDTVSHADQKKALMTNDYSARKLRGTFELYDTTTGQLLDSKLMTLARVPYLSKRGTFVRNGNSFAPIIQSRLMPGVYTRRQANGGLETQFNPRPGSGLGFRVGLEPATGQFRLRAQGSNIHLYSLLKRLGADDKQLEEAWGKDLLEMNRQKFDPKALQSAYQKLVPRRLQDPAHDDAAKIQAVRDAFDAVQVHKKVVTFNLPHLLDQQKAAALTDMLKVAQEQERLPSEFSPDLTPSDLREAYNSIYGHYGPRLASMQQWPDKWLNQEDPMGWLQWFENYHAGRRSDDDERQIARWKAFKARHGAAFVRNPTPRRAFALRNWAIDPIKLLPEEQRAEVEQGMENYKRQAWEDWASKHASFRAEDLQQLVIFLNAKLGANLDPNLPSDQLIDEIMQFIGGNQVGVDVAMARAAAVDAQDAPMDKQAAAKLKAAVLLGLLRNHPQEFELKVASETARSVHHLVTGLHLILDAAAPELLVKSAVELPSATVRGVQFASPAVAKLVEVADSISS